MAASSMFCQTATDLIRELKRSQKWLPAYNVRDEHTSLTLEAACAMRD
jgi:hypothetical protein